MAKQEFDSKVYWQERHQRYGESPLGVGNATFSAEKNAQIYDAARGYISRVLKALDLPPASRVLDVGCGIGMISDCFIGAGMLYTGVDISEDAIAIARQKHPFGAFVVGDVSQIQFAEPFALVIERTVMIHVVEDDLWRNALASIARNLADDGMFIM